MVMLCDIGLNCIVEMLDIHLLLNIFKFVLSPLFPLLPGKLCLGINVHVGNRK